jgi:hypothetical protein
MGNAGDKKCDFQNNLNAKGGLGNYKHSIDQSMEFQGHQMAPKVELILDFHWLAVLVNLRTVISDKYYSRV